MTDETIVQRIQDLEIDTNTEPYLIVIAGTNIGKLYDLKGKDFIAGRSPDNTIWIEDNTISRKHFRITNENGLYTIIDLNSTNGTFINNKRVSTTTLRPGDKIRISKDTIMQFDYYDEQRKVNELKRYEMGVMDPVTNTYNKTYLLQRIKEEFSFSRRQKLPLSVVMFDVDHFKVINDTYGHLAGDQVLQEISARVMAMIRKDDVFCRYGGEEFLLIMRNTDNQAAVNLAERIRRLVEESPADFDGQKIKITVSLGVATLTDKIRDYVALIAESDKYLFKSKGSGRNCVSALNPPNLP